MGASTHRYVGVPAKALGPLWRRVRSSSRSGTCRHKKCFGGGGGGGGGRAWVQGTTLQALTFPQGSTRNLTTQSNSATNLQPVCRV